ncbi:LuxR C-terminal-related transcriptional regulator [Nocardioides sp. URHA0020]|uniref:LuxR C-terminal-related transcriptional regulator n=1 Tax=Nocardioides sp. URHA0020 TaxID=1380392 RepID=UPI00048A5FCA|nr:LuxR C-terminal-related transcriptional regulator [Nocardioides sp. URHA0020]
MRADTEVLVIDDPTLFAESLCAALEVDGFDAHRLDADAAVARSGQDARHADDPPLIAVLDLDLGSRWDPLDLITTFTALGARVVVVTATDDRAVWADCLTRGAVQVLAKTAPMADVLTVAHRIRAGLPVVDAAERLGLLAERQRQTRRRQELAARFSQLNHLEHWVLERLVEGSEMRDIARDAGLTSVDVRSQVQAIVDKLQVTSWLEAVLLANDLGWGSFDDVS